MIKSKLQIKSKVQVSQKANVHSSFRTLDVNHLFDIGILKFDI
jgi:hypothetical protein